MKKAQDNIRVIRVHPGKSPESIIIPNTLEALQSEIGGYIETVNFIDGLICIVDEEGLIKGLPDNVLGLHGNIIVAQAKGENFISLTDKESEMIMEFLKKLR